MSTPIEAALSALADAALHLQAFDAKAATGEIPAEYAAKERARLAGIVRGADAASREVVQRYDFDEWKRAQALRAQDEADVPADERLARIAERDDLMKSTLDGPVFVARAAEFLAAGRPDRAALFLAAASARGLSPMDAADANAVQSAVDDALDKVRPRRAEARAIEDAAAASEQEFARDRLRVLALSVGTSPDGSAGFGSASEKASAHVAATVAAAMSGTASFQVGDNSNQAGEA